MSEARTVRCELVTDRVRHHQRGLRTCLLQNQGPSSSSVLDMCSERQDRHKGFSGQCWGALGSTGSQCFSALRFPVDVGLRHDLRVLQNKTARALFSQCLPTSQILSTWRLKNWICVDPVTSIYPGHPLLSTLRLPTLTIQEHKTFYKSNF